MINPKELVKTPCVYMYENQVNGKIYIGSTVNLYQRHYEHRRKGYPIGRALRKYGDENFTLTVLNHIERTNKKSKLKKDLLEMEQFYINLFKPNLKHGYNILNEARSVLGYKHKRESDESKAVAIKQYSLSGELIKEWERLSDVEKELGINHSKVSACLHKNRRTAGGFQWVRKEDPAPDSIGQTVSNPIAVKMIDQSTGNVIKEFPSIYKAAKEISGRVDDKEIGKVASKISAVTKGKRRSAWGYIWLIKPPT